MELPGGPDAGLGDDALAGLVAEGREDALAALYDRYATEVFRTALRVNSDRSTAEEVVQETFLALWNRAELFDPARGSLGGWLAAIARHRAIDRHRAAGRRLDATPFSSITGGDLDDGPTVEWLVASGVALASGAPEPTPEVVVTTREDVADIATALAGLSADERESILLAYRDGLSQAEIAALLGWPLGTVKTRSRRALRRLRDALLQAGESPAASATVSTAAHRTPSPTPGPNGCCAA